MNMANLKLVSLFAGIGGIDLGFQLAGVEPVWANEIDEFCAKTFIPNHPETELLVDDINNVSADDSAIGIIFTIFREMYHTHTYKTWVKFMNQLLWYSKCDEDIVVDESVLLENEPIRVVYLGNSKWKSIDPHY